MRKLYVIALVLVAGCTNFQPANEIAAIQSILTAAETASLAYVRQPICPERTPLCAERGVLETIQRLDNIAFEAVVRARNAQRDGAGKDILDQLLISAREAVLAYRSIIAALPGE